MPHTIPLAQYLFTRLHQLGCHSIHGVPGDFFLRALDHIPASKTRWIGNANELCAGYAADGYARAAAGARRGNGLTVPQIGALFTTYGVGELSAINAVAGAYAESVPMVHFVGTPSRQQWKDRPVIHHSLADGNLGIYAEIAKKFAVADADLRCDSAQEAVERYDYALAEGVKKSKPVYVNLPSDMISKEVSTISLDTPLDTSIASNADAEENQVIDSIINRIKSAKRPLIIADGYSYPWDLVNEANEIARVTNFPSMCFNAGKGVIDENIRSWVGPLTAPTEYTQSVDLALLIGPLLSDTNTAAWLPIPDPKVSISFNLDNVIIGSDTFAVSGKKILQALITRLLADSSLSRRTFDSTPTKTTTAHPLPTSLSAPIGQDALWTRLSSWLRPHDTLLLANGTPLIGGREMNLPSPCNVIASGIWNAIGSMLPCAQGVTAAKRDHNLPGRTIIFEGDGSFQVTCQSISDIIRYELDVTVVIVNNAGYTYERLLHGPDEDYNDVPAWRYTDAAHFFGADAKKASGYKTMSRRVETWGELEEVLGNQAFADGKGLKIIDIIVDPSDVPESARAGLRRASENIRSM